MFARIIVYILSLILSDVLWIFLNDDMLFVADFFTSYLIRIVWEMVLMELEYKLEWGLKGIQIEPNQWNRLV